MAASAQASSPSGGRPSIVRIELEELLKLSGPVVLARLGIMTMGLSDAIVVGRFSAEQLSFHALAWAPTAVVLTMAIGLLSGVQVMTARAIGEGRRDQTGAVLRRGMVYGAWIGLVSMAVLAILGPPGLHLLGLEPRLADGAAPVVVVFSLSLPTYVVACAATFWLEALSKPTPAMLIMWGANLVNLVLLILLVPGTFGLPAHGAVGAAWSTFGARAFLLVGLVTYIATMKEAGALGVFRKPERDRVNERTQRQVGYGAGVSNFFEVAAFSSMNVIAGWIGGLAVAAWTVVLNVTALVFMVPLGLSTATAVLVGRAYGAREHAGVLRAGALGFSLTTAFGVVASLAIWPSAGLIAQAYTTDPAVIAAASGALVVACLFFLTDALQVVTAQALRARGDVWAPSVTHLASYVVVMMPLAWWLAIPRGMGIAGLVWAVVAASLVSAGLLLTRFWTLGLREG
ncbi:MATE family efflux transporter [Phenylobacterium sp.]|uniref:MATE family efflux transporter n=1 Tax=Phenylobacterium sp. TaxID=1871053 RepID=UPI0035B24953